MVSGSSNERVSGRFQGISRGLKDVSMCYKGFYDRVMIVMIMGFPGVSKGLWAFLGFSGGFQKRIEGNLKGFRYLKGFRERFRGFSRAI